jgi:hypothetical protein
MADDDEVAITGGPVHDRPGPTGGPRSWVVLAGTAAAAVAVLGGVFGYQAWRDDDEAAPAPTVVPGTAPAAEGPLDAGAFLFRRVTADGIEIRARLNDAMRGGVFMDVAPGVAIAEDGGGTAPDVVIESVPGPEGILRPATTPAPPATAEEAAAPTTGPAPVPVDPGIGGRVVDPDDLPEECQVVGDLTAWAISDTNVAQGGGPWMKVGPEELYPSLMWDGMVDPNDPDALSIVGMVLQVPDDVTMVRMRTATATDEMAPVEGAAVLAVLARAADVQDVMNGAMGDQLARNTVQITAERADGSLLSASLLDAMTKPHPAWGPACQPGVLIEEPAPVPTTTLPAPGAEQPTDPTAARAEIEHNFAALYGGDDPAAARAMYVDDVYGLAEAGAQVVANFPEAATDATVSIHEVVFVDAANAVFRYDLETSSADFRDQVGRARLLDGVWKITRGTQCQDLAHGGGICPP